MTKWKLHEILDRCRKQVETETAGWSEAQLREKLAELLTAITPIKATLTGLIDNPDVRHGGMTVTSGLFLDTAFDGVEAGLPEPWGVQYHQDKPTWRPVAFKWSEPQPEDIQKVEVDFRAGEVLHDDTPILSIWQYATACSIFVGSFDASDVRHLVKACQMSEDSPCAS